MKKDRFISLNVKLSIGVIFFCLLIGLISIVSVTRIAANIIDREYMDKAEQIPRAVVTTLDPQEVKEITDIVIGVYDQVGEVVPSTEWGSDEWNAYMANYEGIEELPLFKKLRDHFQVYQDIYKVDCIYLTRYYTDIKEAIYIVDGDFEDPCPPGVVDAFEDGLWPSEDDPFIPATITNEEVYGWLVSSACPIYVDGELFCHLCVDISMNEIKDKERSYVIEVTLFMVAATILLLAFALWYVNGTVVRPVTMLSDTAKNYCSENNDVVHHAFEKLEITTHDEIAQLLNSMKQMETDMNSNITSLISTKTALKETEEKASTMQALAVRDALTGVRNKTAYDLEVEKLEAELKGGFRDFGLAMVDLNFLKRTNDTYGHENGNVSIKNLCALVCLTFKHSPVFRVGGDEFVVILRNQDLSNVDRLVENFNASLQQLQHDTTLEPWEKISAAIGYALYDQNADSSVEDVFKRADKAMYERKTAMKAERKD